MKKKQMICKFTKRMDIISKFNQRVQPKFIHPAGTKLIIRNDPKNMAAFQHRQHTAPEINYCDDLVIIHNFRVLEGPPSRS